MIRHIGVILRGVGAKGKCPSSIFFYLRIVKSAKNVCLWGDSGEKGCMYLKNWFKRIFPIFLTSLFRKLKFLTPTVDFSPPPPACY